MSLKSKGNYMLAFGGALLFGAGFYAYVARPAAAMFGWVLP